MYVYDQITISEIYSYRIFYITLLIDVYKRQHTHKHTQTHTQRNHTHTYDVHTFGLNHVHVRSNYVCYALCRTDPVSYTHLDVYKRQIVDKTCVGVCVCVCLMLHFRYSPSATILLY